MVGISVTRPDDSNFLIDYHIALIVGLAVLSFALAFRLGFARRLGHQYLDTRLPTSMRYVVFTLVPAGCGFLLMWIAVVMAQASDDVPGPVDLLIFVPLLGLLACGVWMYIRWWRPPPEYLKPKWVREVEEERKRLE